MIKSLNSFYQNDTMPAFSQPWELLSRKVENKSMFAYNGNNQTIRPNLET